MLLQDAGDSLSFYAAAITDLGVGHWIVAGHVTQRRAHYQCPSIGPDSQGRTTFMNAWRDVDRLGAVYRQWAIVAWR